MTQQLSQPTPIPLEQLEIYAREITEGGLPAARAVYLKLSAAGYGYAGWANGVATGTTITGQSALAFLSDSALMGLESQACRNLSASQLDAMRVTMAEYTMAAYIEIATENGNVLTREQTFDEISDVHANAFAKYHLTLANWTLYTPMELIRRNEGDAVVEAVWQQLVATGGSGPDAVMASLGLRSSVEFYARSPDPTISGPALEWLATVPGFTTPGKSWEIFMRAFTTDGTAVVPVERAPAVIIPPADFDTVARDSSSFVAVNSAHTATIAAGGTLSDLWATQRNQANGFSNAQQFYDAVLASNPSIADANNIRAGQTIYLPQRLSDGSVTYHYAEGVSINSNAVTGEYRIVTPDGAGGTIVYSRQVDADVGYTVGTTRSNSAGNVTEQTLGQQLTLDSGVTPYERRRVSDDAAFSPWGGFDPFSDHSLFTQDAAGRISVNAPTTPLPDIGMLFDAEERLAREYAAGWVSAGQYEAFQDYTLAQSLGSGGLSPGNGNGSGLELQPPAGTDFWSDPIGAFYDSQSAAFDRAASIAPHTGVLLDPGLRRVGAQQLARLDVDGDAQLTTRELAGYSLWTDLNENGFADAGETAAVADSGLGVLERANWTLHTQGYEGDGTDARAGWHLQSGAQGQPLPGMLPQLAAVSSAALRPQPLRPGPIHYAPPSGWRMLRDTDNVYGLAGGQFIAWAPTQVKINSQTRDAMVGTEGNDRFDASYYGAYSSYFNLSLLVRFLAGPGDDTVGGSTRADSLWGGTGDDQLLGYEGNDTLYGEEGNDELQGNAGNDTLDGGIGDDRLFGQTGNDILYGGEGNDTLVGFAASNDLQQTLASGETDDDVLYGEAGADNLYGGLGNDVLDGGIGDDALLGEAGDDTLFGADGTDELQGGIGNDRLLGDAGDDNLFGQAGDDVLWGGEGNDLLMGFTATNESQQTLSAGQTDRDALYGEGGNDRLWGGLGDDVLDGGAGADLIDGGDGADYGYGQDGDDQLQGGAGNDMLNGGADNDTLLGGLGSDRLLGGSGDDELQGGDGTDQLAGGTGQDKLFGQVGNDILWGGDGNDILVGFTADNEAQQSLYLGQTDDDVMFGESGNDNLYGGLGDDLLDGGVANDLLDGGEGNDRLLGGDGADELQGGAGADRLAGGAGDDKLFGQLGDDQLWGGDGNDLLMGFTGTNEARQTLQAGESDNDVMDGGAGSDVLMGGLGDDRLYGGEGRDELQGNAGNDALYGEAGDDNLFGQAGDDVLYGGEGDDFLSGFTASNEAQQALEPGETDQDRLYGGAGRDTLVGAWGDDWLDGGADADTMVGGQGDDTYIVNSVNDVIYERADEGHDVVFASTTCLLGAQLEELHLLEGFAIHGTGNGQDNLLVGNSSDNILDGVTGADRMIGGAGDDTYYVDNTGDAVVEQAAQGQDTVQASIGYTLGADVENLVLLDFSKPENGLVDGRAVLVYGYPKRNELDYMQGDAVADFWGTCALTSIANVLTQTGRPTSESQVVTLAIDNGWTVSDAALPAWQLGGTKVQDQRQILDSYGIRNDVIDGYNEAGLANLLRGGRGVVLAVNAGALWGDAAHEDGGAVNHAVTLTGAVYDSATGALSGFYIADSGRGSVNDMTRFVDVETFRAAADVPGAYSIYTLDPVKLWDEDIDATGNALDNQLVGNRGHNVLAGLGGDDLLQGGAGDDTLDGGAGNDVLAGGTGNDVYRIGIASGADRIEEDDATAGNHDLVQFEAGVSREQLWFARTGDDLTVSVLGSADAITVSNWYAGDRHHVEAFRLDDGHVLVDRDVNLLVQAMAAFSPPAMGETQLSANQQQALMPLFASSWHSAAAM